MNDERSETAHRVTRRCVRVPSDAELGFGDEPREDGAVPDGAVPGDETSTA